MNSSSDLASCFAHLDGIVGPLKQAISGGRPAVRGADRRAQRLHHQRGKDGRYILPTRDLIAADIEVAVEGAQLDGMICLASCDKTVPGQLMAAARLNIPTLIVPCGYQPCGPVPRREAGHRGGVPQQPGTSPPARSPSRNSPR